MAKPTTAHEKTSRQLKRGVVKAAFSPVNVSVMAAATAGAAALGSLGVLAAGGVAYVAMVAWDLSSKSFWSKVVGAPPEPGLPAPERLFDPETRSAVAGIAAARAQIARAMSEAPASVASHIEPVVASLAELDGRVGRLAGRADQIARHLATTSVERLRGEVDDLNARAAGVRDPSASIARPGPTARTSCAAWVSSRRPATGCWPAWPAS
jgi:hypothetical protein